MRTWTKLTEREVASLPASPAGTYIAYESLAPGFGVRVTRRGVKAFVLNYRCRGRERRITIGRFPTWSAQAARIEAQRLRREIDVGNDPLEQRYRYKVRPAIKDLCARYIAEHLPRKRASSQRNDLAYIRRWIIPALGRVPVEEISFNDVDRLQRSMSKTPCQANRVLSLLSKMLNLARKWGWATENAACQVERYPEQPRDRFMTLPESKRLLAVVDRRAGEPGADAIKLILLTGARKTEVLSASWVQFDLQLQRWSKPAATTKQKRIHHLPLNQSAIALLTRMRESSTSPLLFPGANGKPQKDARKAWRAICREAQVEGFRIHDLRHTYASLVISAGESLHTVGTLLGHSQPSTTSRYAHLLDEVQRRATNSVSAVLAQPNNNGPSKEETTP